MAESDFAQLNNELIELKEKIRTRQKLMSDIERTAGTLYDEKIKLKNLDSAVKKENEDVKKLEGMSLTGLFQNLPKAALAALNSSEQNAPKAIEWFEKAAEQGLQGAMTTIGMMYREGNGVERDEEKAKEWFRKAGFDDF